MSRTCGISGMKLYVPPQRVDLERWCDWTGTRWDKVRAVVGTGFRMAGPHETIYTMAANAVLRLIQDYEVDVERVGMLAFGTESSTDNSAGAIIVKGMVDQALRDLGRRPLSRRCEVPELKHACLGGVYALKAALRYVASDGAGRQAIVVCGDIAEYARGSSGEPTQGAGAVAMLVEEDPALLALDLRNAGSASDYRGPDFRKPFARYAERTTDAPGGKVHDYPRFSGPYSTTCYVDEVIQAVAALRANLGLSAEALWHEVDDVYLHRPYHHMPQSAMAALHVWGLAEDPSRHAELRRLCEEGGCDLDAALAETRATPSLFDAVLGGKLDGDVYPNALAAARRFRRTSAFGDLVASRMSRGAGRMMELGNLYTASLPAWLAAALDEAAGRGEDLSGHRVLLIGYGSGDAAEAIPATVQPGWAAAARRIGFTASLAGAIDVDRATYEALHAGLPTGDLGHRPSNELVVDHVGDRNDPEFQDASIEYYRYVP